MEFGGATVVQLYRMVELMNPGRIVDLMILIGQRILNNVSRSSVSEEGQWEAMLVCLISAVWQKLQCPIMTVCTVPLNAKTQSAVARRHYERVVRWNNKVRNLANRNAGRIILVDMEQEMEALDQATFTTDGIYFDNIEGQVWMNRVFQQRLDELEAQLNYSKLDY